MGYFKKILEVEQFDKQLANLAKKYSGKRVVLYGAGKFFQAIRENYDLSCLNIVAISDYNYLNFEAPVYDEMLGFNKVSPLQISAQKPDIVLLTVIDDYFVEKYFCEELFVDRSKKFRYKPIFIKSLNRKINEEYAKTSTNVNPTVFLV